MTAQTNANPTCPFCHRPNVIWKQKAGQWECNDCEERFAVVPPADRRHKLGDKTARPKSIFFSYGHDSNRELVELFRTDLEKRGHKVWIDWKEIGTWDDWRGSITRGIDRSELTIAFISHHAMRDPGVCRNEIAIAMNRFGTVHLVLLEEDAAGGIPIIATDRQWDDLSQWRAIRDGKVAGVDWERWYEEKLINLIDRLENEATPFADEIAALRQVLSPTSFESRITQHLPGFIGREWVFDAYRNWLDKPDSRLFWIKAGPGVGKSAIAANLVARERSAIVASWFCDAKSAELKNSDHALRSLAFQLALRWDEYRVRLLRQLELGANASEEMQGGARRELGLKNTQDLFRVLFTEPLNGLTWRENKLAIVVDALDEATDSAGQNRITELIAMELERLPAWITFVVTSRPEAAVVARLQGFKPFAIDATDERNLADLHAWYQTNLAGNGALASLASEEQRRIEHLLIERSQGMILYLKLIEEGLREESLTVEDVNRLEAGLPGLHRRYFDSFAHRFGDDYEMEIRPLLRLLLAAGGPLPEDLACAVLEWNREQFLRARNRLGSYVVDSPAGLELFHKTLAEWLTNKASADYFVDPTPARQAIADVLFAELGREENHSLRWENLIVSSLPAWIPGLRQRNEPKNLDNLALLLYAIGYYGEAEPLYRESLALRRAALPAGHPEIGTSLYNLATVLHRSICRYAEAESLYREALNLRRTALPTGHPEIGTILTSLAELLATTGQLVPEVEAKPCYREAEQLFREALDLWRTALPAAHPNITRSLSGLAILLDNTGYYTEAELLFREALNLRRTTLSTGHPDILANLSNLAILLDGTGRSAEAESLLREMIELNRTTHSAGHPSVADGLYELARLLENAGRRAEAELLYREALDLRRTALPTGHPDILKCLLVLAGLSELDGRLDDAELFYREALETDQT